MVSSLLRLFFSPSYLLFSPIHISARLKFFESFWSAPPYDYLNYNVLSPFHFFRACALVFLREVVPPLRLSLSL